MYIDVECTWPVSVHDAKVFKNFIVCKKLQSGKFNQTSLNLLPRYDTLPNYIIGDPAYPLTPYCIKEYQACVKNKQVVFNNLFRSARNQIECAFGRLKARWSVLTKTVDLKFEIVPVVVYSCFILYNFWETKNYFGVEEEEVEA